MLDYLRPERALVLYALEGQDLTCWAAFGVEPESVWTTAPLSLSIFERVYRSGEPLLCGDTSQEPSLMDISSLVISGIRTVMCVPVFREDQVKGLLHVDLRMREATFNAKDLSALTNLARDLERRLNQLSRQSPRPGPPPRPIQENERNLPPLPLAGRSRVLFLRCLSTMVGAGITLTRALALLSQQTAEDPGFAAVAERMLATLQQGYPLAEAMRRSHPAFQPFQIQMVGVAERSGTLVQVLSQLARAEEKARAFSMRLRSSLTYPLFLFGLCTLMLLLAPPFLLRGQLNFLRSVGSEPPAITRYLLAASSFLSSPAGVAGLLVGLVSGATGVGRLRRNPQAYRAWLQRFLAVPRLGSALRLLATARFARSLALQLQVGLSIAEALPAAGVVSGNPILHSQLLLSLEALVSGQDLHHSLKTVTLFPTGFISIIRASEESGRMPETLNWMADAYELELELSLEAACAALEPLLMMGMGIAAALVCLATMLPMVKLVQNL
jgi:type II secretory pathway component PulF